MFSETVDTVVNRAKRPDKLVDAVNFVNAALRFLHGQHFFADDAKELRLLPHTDAEWHGANHNHQHQHGHHHLGGSQFAHAVPGIPGHQNFQAAAHLQFVGGPSYFTEARHGRHGNVYVWEHPREFRKLEAVRYDEREYATFKMPSRQMHEFCHFYYRSQQKHIFVGWKNIIDLYFYCFPPYFQYYKPNERPAVFNRATGAFDYRNPLGLPGYVGMIGTHALEREARDKVYDWMLDRWNELVVSKSLELLYVHLQDPRSEEVRAEAKSLQETMIAAEAVFPIGV
jgi:hypothetical protein